MQIAKAIIFTNAGVAWLCRGLWSSAIRKIGKQNIRLFGLDCTRNNDGFDLLITVKLEKGVEGKFKKRGYEYRIDTYKVAPGERGFHIS